MRTNDFLTSGERTPHTYASPQVSIFTLRSEGVLCGSFDEDNFTEEFDREDMEDL